MAPWPSSSLRLIERFLGQRLVEIGDVAGELGEIEPLPVAMLRAGLGAGDREQGVEGLDQPIGVLQRLLEQPARFVRGRARPSAPPRCASASG